MDHQRCFFHKPPEETPASYGAFCRFVDPDGNQFRLAGFDEVSRQVANARKAIELKHESERRATQELDIAGEVQQRLLPQCLPHSTRFDCGAFLRQARAVGGDLYDIYELTDHRLRFMLGDVAGKGLPASLLMATLQAHIRALTVYAPISQEDLLRSVNTMLLQASATHVYSTMILADYDPASGLLRYANCGHVPGLL